MVFRSIAYVSAMVVAVLARLESDTNGSQSAQSVPDALPVQPTWVATENGIETYMWSLGGKTQKFSIVVPSSAKFPVPIIINLGYSAPPNYNAFGVAMITTIDPMKVVIPSIVNDKKPQPCSQSDSPSIAYFASILEFIESNSTYFDANKIFTVGMSSGSMDAAYLSFCFSEKIAGLFQIASGMVVPGFEPNPHCGWKGYGNRISNVCKKASSDCQYWPIYPCYEPSRPMVWCGAANLGDMCNASMGIMYDYTVKEGFDSRLILLPGGHHGNPPSIVEWEIGCLGVTPPCSEECAKQSSGLKRDSPACTPGCAATKEMLVSALDPAVLTLSQGTFGAPTGRKPRPSTSKCVHRSLDSSESRYFTDNVTVLV